MIQESYWNVTEPVRDVCKMHLIEADVIGDRTLSEKSCAEDGAGSDWVGDLRSPLDAELRISLRHESQGLAIAA